ncbi:UDP-N-acetylmuramoyl-tripeptide--D-alanyl-D-alanine ligase [Ferrimonas balearica]|uniref:UDP-N-acetylmuramoyl-tripeptide--D-alanyl-D- alanine ligase n=1 Tax=Ferrimonas balearica TaxID=44012 RepID=UPI001F443073|nr:UDP-N-acetylmuramoyl-tripeptide--D-alanyl-D-alanine ligase [Ferrimonas balearica]MBY6096512.1 UDP-N-acetylmuramoyl-tripeptide--D-alanyl-D-alanine ligase [Ferrimonas balearica]
MIPVTLSILADAVGGTLNGADLMVSRIGTDTRALAEGDLFLALVGERFDGHEFVAQAEASGAAALVVSRPVDSALPQILVEDTLLALGQMGAWLRRELAPRCLAITGSVGKTSVKEMTAAIFAQVGPTLATRGNLNNTIGVPMTLLELTPEHRFAVIELGANHAGEIRYTSSLALPHAAVINNIRGAHLEGFGGIEGVARAKSEIYEHLGEAGTAIVNLDDEWAPWLLERLGDQNRFTYSSRGPADLWASALSRDADGCYHFLLHRGEAEVLVRLPLPGRHQVDNALAAAALASTAELSLEQIASGLAQAPTVAGRTQMTALSGEVMLIDDSYNANAASTIAAIDLMAERDGSSLLVFGDMGELGEEAEAEHRTVGRYAGEKGIDRLLTVGTLSRFAAQEHDAARHFGDQAELLPTLMTELAALPRPVTVLIKGSRSARMENVAKALREQLGEHE